MTKVTPLFPTAASPTTAANSIYPPAPMIVDAMEDERASMYEVDPLDVLSTRQLIAAALGMVAALCIIAVLP